MSNDLEDRIAKLHPMTPIKIQWRREGEEGEIQIGFIAAKVLQDGYTLPPPSNALAERKVLADAMQELRFEMKSNWEFVICRPYSHPGETAAILSQAEAYIRQPVKFTEELVERLTKELEKFDGDFDYPDGEKRVWLEGYFDIRAALEAAFNGDVK